MNDIDLKTIIIDPHAIKRAHERFGLKEYDAKSMLKGIVRNGRDMGETTCERGNRGHLIAQGRKAAILSMDYSVIITVMDIKQKSYTPKIVPSADPVAFKNPLYDKLIKLYDTEIGKRNRIENSRMKKLEDKKIILGVEIAQLKLKLHKTRSEKIKEECNKKLVELNNEIWEFEVELKKLQDEKRNITYARVSLG